MTRIAPLLLFLASPIAAQSWIDRATPDLTHAYQRPGAYDPVSDRLLVVDRWGGTWAATATASGVTWTPLPDVTLRAAPPATVALAFDGARGRLLASAFSPTANFEWDGDDWQQIASSAAPNKLAFDPVRGVLVGITDPYLGAATPVFERVGTSWSFLGLFAVPGRGPIAWDPVRGEVLMHGRDGSGVLRTHAWNGAAWTLLASNSGPDTTAFVLATDTARDRVVAHGGVRGGGAVPDTWEWDGSAWSLAGTAGIPPAENRALAYVDSLQRIVAYGGVSSSLNGLGLRDADVWTWDGAAWARLPAATPGWRKGHAIAHDPVRGQTVLFGGSDANGVQADTWIWDGAVWAQQATALAPPARRDHAMAFDSLRGVVLLFGGTDGAVDLADLWQWDGNAWSQVPTLTMPAPRSSPAVAYDAARDRLVVFGGTTLGGGWRNDTVEWDGSAWLPRTPPNTPPALVRPLMAHDAVRQITLLHDGGTGATFEWDGIDYAAFGSSSPFATATAMWFDPVLGQVRSNVPTAVSGMTSVWHNGAWSASTLPDGSAGPIVHDAARGQPFAFDGRRTRLATQSPATKEDVGSGCGTASGIPALATHGAPALGGGLFGFDVHAPATGITLAAIGAATAPAAIPLGGGCTWRLSNAVAGPLLVTSAAGFAAWTIPVPSAPILLGIELYGQGVVLDSHAPLGWALTQAIKAVVGD